MPEINPKLAVLSAIPNYASKEPAAAPASPLAPNWNQLLGAVAIQVERAGKRYLSSAVMISPTQGLTAAHSVNGVEAHHIKVISDIVIEPQSKSIALQKIRVHPEYQGNNFDGIDLAYFELRSPLSLPHYFVATPLARSDYSNAVLQRIGFGARPNHRHHDHTPENRRTWVLEMYDRKLTGAHYLTSRDQYGFPGDSGGPVFTTQDSKQAPKLVGLHVGRMLQNDGTPSDESNTLVLTPDLVEWVRAQTTE